MKIIFKRTLFGFQSPPKGATIPYRPKPQVGGPVILAGGQAYTIQGNYAVPAQDVWFFHIYFHLAIKYWTYHIIKSTKFIMNWPKSIFHI